MQSRSIRRALAVAALSASLLPLGASPVAAAETFVVSPADLNGWTPNAAVGGSVTFVPGPEVPPLGAGSVRLAPAGASGSFAQISADYGSVELEMLWDFTFETYTDADTPAPRLVFAVDLDANGSQDDTWTFDPNAQPLPTVAAPAASALGWQNWNATAGVWTSAIGLAGAFGPEDGRSIYDLIGAAPDPRWAGPSGIRLIATDATGHVDNVGFWLGDTHVLYDFEPGEDVTPTVRDLKAQVLAGLAAVAPTGNRDTDRRIGDAIEALQRALDRPNWTDGDRIDGKKADRIFNDEAAAVKALAGIKANAPAETLTWIAILVSADRQLVEVAIADAAAGGDLKGVEKAQKELARGDAEAAKGKAENAIDHYRNAWKHVGR